MVCYIIIILKAGEQDLCNRFTRPQSRRDVWNMYAETIEKKLTSAVGTEKAQEILTMYVQLETQIQQEQKSKVMYYQRRKGMKMVLGALGVQEFELECWAKERSAAK